MAETTALAPAGDAEAHAPTGRWDPEHPAARLFAGAPKSVTFRKLRKRLVRQAGEAIARYGMVTPRRDGAAPRWLVCLSGGKDSYTLLAALLELQAHGALPVELIACNLDQGQPGFPRRVLPDWLGALGVAHRIETKDTYSVVTGKIAEGGTYCWLCSRMRRAILYDIARAEDCDAIVLGHHADDALETFLMNLFHGGKLAAMPPKLLNDEGDLLALRPLILSQERDIAAFAKGMDFPIIPCTLCGSQQNAQRQKIKAMLAEWEAETPGRKSVMAAALANASPSHLLDPSLFDFMGLSRNR